MPFQTLTFRKVLLLAALALPAAALLAQQSTLPLWPDGTPEPSHVTGPEFDPSTAKDANVGGFQTLRVTNVSKPTLTVYAPTAATNTGAAALVFPGGSYVRLAYNIEGTEVCTWLHSLGVTCVLVKYRVPESGHFPQNTEDLEDAQQAMRLTRAHAAEWHLDPNRIGVVGFSAGAHLAVSLSTHPDFKVPDAQESRLPASTLSARPDFQILLYPGWLAGSNSKVDPALQPTSQTPPTFLVMAENDYTAHVENALVYFGSLKDAKVPAELHLFTQGGHGFGLRPTGLPIAGWPSLAAAWLHTIHMLGPKGPVPQP